MKNASAAGGPSLPQPYIAAATIMPEFTLRAVIVGTLLGMIFGASSLYLVLKVGLTVSASIPVAVISITLFRLASKLGVRDATSLPGVTARPRSGCPRVAAPRRRSRAPSPRSPTPTLFPRPGYSPARSPWGTLPADPAGA